MDDDYVAQVLAKEAQDSSQKYSTEGLGAYRAPRKPAANAPKPNTRFLRHLIKETDNHNVALKRKEEKEARERMRQLRDQSTTASTSTSHTSRRHDRRDTVRGSDRHSAGHSAEHREDRHRSHRRRHRSRSTSADRDRSRRHRLRDEDYDRSRDGHRERTGNRRERHRHESSRTERRDRERSYSRSRSRSPRRDRTSRRHRSERHHRRSKSPSGTRSSQSHRERRSKHDEDVSSRAHLSPKTTKHREAKSPSPAAHHSDGESDPLEDLVGPLPPQANGEPSAPIRSRGRGAYKPNSSTIDSHFAPDYDPTLDVQPDDDGTSGKPGASRRPVAGLMDNDDDWDMALEAFRDRTRWRQKGEERLRAAGLGENNIDRWKGNSAFTGVDGEGKPEDVRWSKKGEGREWDRGKFVNNDGHIDVRAAWQS